MAYTSKVAGALSGATQSQLSHWRKTDLLTPEDSHSSKVRYSFRDVVALRTFVYLRQTVSLQAIRAAVENLRSGGEVEHPSEYRLVSCGRHVVLVREGEDTNLNTNETLLVRFDVVRKPFKNARGREVLDLYAPYPEVSIHPAVLAGFPVVRGTRVPYDVVAGLMDEGMEPSSIQYFYPRVGEAGAKDAQRFAEYVASTQQVA